MNKYLSITIEDETIQILKQLLDTLKYLHQNYICHRDITGSNILISESNTIFAVNCIMNFLEGDIKIIDFNISRKLKNDQEIRVSSAPVNTTTERKLRRRSNCSTMLTPKGTLQYQAPEMLMGSFYTHSVDMWSVGVITYYCLMGYRPFHSKMLY